ncbi:hypothetical protein EV368DRAFT_87095 [Lentinula lateritia]|nr:hypothetical protein EV368DRAFT_87095 [Lentinula lateritia]
MEPKVTFAPGLASDVVKPSRPSRKIPTEKDYGPLAYAIILPRRAMLPRLAETDPDIIENVDLAKLRKQRNAIEISLENMCDEARKIWPNTFGCLVDPTFEDGSCYALGFADNTRPENGWVIRRAFYISQGEQGLAGRIHWNSDPPRAEFCPGLSAMTVMTLLTRTKPLFYVDLEDQEQLVSVTQCTIFYFHNNTAAYYTTEIQKPILVSKESHCKT